LRASSPQPRRKVGWYEATSAAGIEKRGHSGVPKGASEVEAGDRIRESGARNHRSGVIEVRPIFEQFVSLRQIAKVQNRTILFEKGEIADRRG
jgi:hypothetical protein